MTDELPPPDAAYFGDHPSTTAYADAGLEAIAVDVHAGLIVRPGDVLVLEAGELTLEIAEAIKAAVLARLPDLADVVVLSTVRAAGVYRAAEVDT